MKTLKTLVAASLVFVSMTAFADDLKVGIVNVQEVFAEAPQGQATVDQMKKAIAPQVTKLNAEETTFQTAVTNFNRNAPTLSATDKATQEQALSTQQQKLQADIASFRKSTEQQQQQAAGVFQKELVNAITEIAQAGDFDMVFTNQTIPFYKDSFDITSQVVTMMSGPTKN